jgi:DNA-binding transcriptional MerR regulator
MTNVYDIFDQNEINDFINQGFTINDIQQAVNEEMSNPLKESYQQTQQIQDPRKKASNSFIAPQFNDNLIQWQLELDSILERVEHMLRGDKPKFENGSIIWKHPETADERIFNELGVAEVMRVLTLYLNRNTILSNYDEPTINTKMLDLGCDLSDLIFLKYEDFGLNDLKKRKLYPMIIREIVDCVHSSYLRALNGGERESLIKRVTVQQSQQMGAGGVTVNTSPQQRGVRGLLNPMRYVKGKYV